MLSRSYLQILLFNSPKVTRLRLYELTGKGGGVRVGGSSAE